MKPETAAENKTYLTEVTADCQEEAAVILQRE